MAASITRETGLEVELLKGSGGIFDVVVDGEMIFSKHDSGRYPEEEEVLVQLRDRAAPSA